MVNAFVLINTEDKQIREIAQGLMQVSGVTEVYPIAGEYDFIVVVRVADNQTLSQIVCEEIIHKPGVRHTKTLFALDAFAKIDLQAAFGISVKLPEAVSWKRGRAGFAAIVGRPNVGKSTFLNRVLGFHLAAVSDKPQTTRSRWRGILTEDETQIVFVDTPGAHEGTTRLNDAMLNTVDRALRDADIVLCMADATRASGVEDDLVARRAAAAGRPVLLLVNKADEASPGAVGGARKFFLARLGAETPHFVISAANGDGCEAVLAAVRERLPEGPFLFGEDDLTDSRARDIAAEMIREAAFQLLEDEVPHRLAVEIDRWQDGPKGVRIDATIFIERDTQRAIVIGRDGKMVNEIRRQAIPLLRELADKRIDLRLFVKVAADWRNHGAFLQNLRLSGPDA